jgi:hypothetical protein
VPCKADCAFRSLWFIDLRIHKAGFEEKYSPIKKGAAAKR